MEIRLKSNGIYFDTYHIYNEECQIIGMFEDHNRGVRERYFIGWRFDNPTKMAGNLTGKTEMFRTEDEAINYSIDEL